MAARYQKKKKLLGFLVTLFALLFTKTAFSQTYILANEELVYSFETTTGKKVVLAKDKNNNYLIYRFGTKSKIEFEFSEKNKESLKKFTYSFYLRGGGPGNEGMDLNYVYFTNNNFKYVIYDTYYSVGNTKNTGVKVIDLTTKKTIDIKGNKKTLKGTLVDFRDSNLLKIGEELFD